MIDDAININPNSMEVQENDNNKTVEESQCKENKIEKQYQVDELMVINVPEENCIK